MLTKQQDVIWVEHCHHITPMQIATLSTSLVIIQVVCTHVNFFFLFIKFDTCIVFELHYNFIEKVCILEFLQCYIDEDGKFYVVKVFENEVAMELMFLRSYGQFHCGNGELGKKEKKQVFYCLPKCEEECHDGYQNQNSTMCNKNVEFMET